MSDKVNKNEGPSCACGKVDLYEEWLKQNQKDAVSADTDPAEKDSSDDTGKQEPKSVQTR